MRQDQVTKLWEVLCYSTARLQTSHGSSHTHMFLIINPTNQLRLGFPKLWEQVWNTKIHKAILPIISIRPSLLWDIHTLRDQVMRTKLNFTKSNRFINRELQRGMNDSDSKRQGRILWKGDHPTGSWEIHRLQTGRRQYEFESLIAWVLVSVCDFLVWSWTCLQRRACYYTYIILS